MSAQPTGSAARTRRTAERRSPGTTLAEADELLSSERLERILRFHGGGLPVVSMYLSVDPAPGDAHAAAMTKADSLLHEIRALAEDRELDHDTRMSLRGDIAAIEQLVDRAARAPGALAIISCTGAGALELVRMPRAIRDRIVVEQTPWVRPLLAVLEQYHRCFVVVVDSDTAHAWELYLGQIRDRGPLARHAGGAPRPRGGSERRAQHKAQELEKRHFREVAAALEGLLGADRGDVLAIGGHEDDFDDLNWERKPYRAWRAYGQSKLANLLFTSELQRRLTAAGSPVLASAAHPGYAATNLQFHSGNRVFDLLGAAGNRVLAQSEDDGALPTLYAALADLPGDSFAGPGGFMEQRGPAKLVGRSSAAKDTDVARRLWDVSEELTGVRFPLSAPVDRTAGA